MTEQEYREIETQYDECKTAILTWDQISISRVQREFRFGYNRAARLLETMAEFGHLVWSNRDGSFRRHRRSETEGSPL